MFEVSSFLSNASNINLDHQKKKNVLFATCISSSIELTMIILYVLEQQIQELMLLNFKAFYLESQDLLEQLEIGVTQQEVVEAQRRVEVVVLVW